MSKIFESTIEEFVIELLQNQGWQYLSPEEKELERQKLSEMVLKNRLKRAIETIIPLFREKRASKLCAKFELPSQNLMDIQRGISPTNYRGYRN